MLKEHLGYVADPVRLEQFRAAVAKVVKRGDTVVDLGCGSGILGLFCLQAGASEVYEVDSTAMLEVARESLTRAGLGDRAVFIQGKAQQVELPERVDVVICDQVGYFGFDYDIILSLRDASQRFLKPGGASIPSRLRLQLAAVESNKCQALTEGWRSAGVPAEFHWLRQHAVNMKHAVDLTREELLGAPSDLGSVDLCEANPDYFSWTTELRIERDGLMHGLGGWFECELAEGVWMTNSPVSDRAIQRHQAFLPIGEVVEVKSGDSVKATIMARPAENLLAWEVEFSATGQKFSHSTWQGELLAEAEIARRNPAHVPRVNREGRARMTVLAYCDGQRSVQEIEQAVLRDHPALFPSGEEICRFVAQVLGRDST